MAMLGKENEALRPSVDHTDQNQPTELTSEVLKTTALALNTRSLKYLHNLDVVTGDTSESGYPMDYRGLGDLMQFTNEAVQVHKAHTGHGCSTAVMLLNIWAKEHKGTIGELIGFLQELEMYDIVEDERFLKYIDEDVRAYNKKSFPVQDPRVDTTTHFVSYSEPGNSRSGLVLATPITPPASALIPQQPIASPNWKITKHDANADEPRTYDAFVIVDTTNARDMKFCKLLMKNCEDKMKFNFCFHFRDVLPGSISDDVLQHLIEHRCRSIIVVLSKTMVTHEQCKKHLSMASASRVADGRIIPILLEPCESPLSIRMITAIDYQNEHTRQFAWTKLKSSIEVQRSRRQSNFC